MNDFMFVFLFAIPCYIISSAVHELGHILMGLKEGFKFYLFIAGPIGFKRNKQDKIVFYIEKNPLLWGGLGATIPVEDKEENYKKFGRILLAGPFTSLFIGGIFLSIGVVFENLFFVLLGAMHLGMAVATLIPVRNGAFYTDGGRWLRMFRNNDTKIVEYAIWSLTQNAIINGSYENMDLDQMMILKNDKDIRTKYVGHFYAYHYYKDNNDTHNTEVERRSLLSLSDKVPKQMVSIYKFN